MQLKAPIRAKNRSDQQVPDFICMNNDGFDGLRRPRHILMELLAARGGKVLFVSSALNSFWQRRRSKYLRFGGIRKMRENLFWYQAPALLRNYFSCAWLDRLSETARAFIVGAMSRLLRLKNPVLFISVPDSDFRKTALRFPGSIIIYNVHDRFLDAQDKWIESHFELLKFADIVLCGSRFILQEIEACSNAKAFLFPPAVDLQLFNAATVAGQPPTRKLRSVIGCVGSLGTQIDWELMEFLSIQLDYDFVFIGPVSAEIFISPLFATLKKRSNVHFLDVIPHDLVPEKILSFDVCLMPYRLTEYTKGVNPLKVLEYLALGKPVVSSAIAAVVGFGSVVGVANSRDEWIAHIKSALETDSARAREDRLSFARAESYDRRLEFLLKLIAEHAASLAANRLNRPGFRGGSEF